jgi:hypothetical protein
MGHKTRIMYIERKAESLDGPARIGRVVFSKTGRSVTYQGQFFHKTKSGFKHNFIEAETGAEYWISGPKKRGGDRLYGGSDGIEIDEDVREEYWTKIRSRPSSVSLRSTD